MNPYYWSCIKQKVSVIPEDKAIVIDQRELDKTVAHIKSTLESLLEKDIYLTGSSRIIRGFNDIDLVVYGSTGEIVKRLHKLQRDGVLKWREELLIREHMLKHQDISLTDYLLLKQNSILHFYFMSAYVNLKLIELEHGFTRCIEPVEKIHYYTGPLEILEPLNPHLIPARYIARIGGEHYLMESLREIYAELSPGVYYVENGRVEYRRTGIYIVPDQGVLRPVSLRY